MKKRNKMLLITSMVLAACGSLCLGRSLTTLPEKEEANQPTEPEEPVASVPQVPVPKTGDSWW